MMSARDFRAFSLNSAKAAWIGRLQIFFLLSVSIMVGPLIDKGYFRLCFTGGYLPSAIPGSLTTHTTAWSTVIGNLDVQVVLIKVKM